MYIQWGKTRGTFKRAEVTPTGQGVTTSAKVSHQNCLCCGVSATCQELKVCSSCKTGTYCSKICQAQHWSKHKKQCRSEDCLKACISHTARKDRQPQLVNLVGKCCIIDCYIQGSKTQALWDTGSQVSIVNEKWKKIILTS